MNRDGSILLSVLVFAAVAIVLTLAFSNSILNLQRNITGSKIVTQKQFQISQILSQIRVEKSLLESTSLAGNEMLKACLLGGPVAATSCTTNCCDAQNSHGFIYLDPSDSSTDITTKKRLFGASADALVGYNQQGNQCSVTDVGYMYGLWGEFKAVCPGGESACEYAEHLRIQIHLSVSPQAATKMAHIKNQDYEAIYFNPRNYAPKVVPMAKVVIKRNSTEDITITGDSGNPSEEQNFIFNLLQSSNSNIAAIVTPSNTPFAGGVAVIQVQGVNVGTTTLQIQINDGGTENALSEVYFLEVEVVL